MPAHRKRESELQRPRERKGVEATTQQVTKGELRPAKQPRVDPDWHPRAKRMLESLRSSGQVDWFQDSDWAWAMILCDQLTAYYENPRKSPEMLKAIISGFEKLMVTEVDRRKARIELTSPVVEEKSAELVAIEGYRSLLEQAQ